MCSSGDSTAKANEQSQLQFSQQLQSDFATTFGQNQGLFKQLSGVLQQALTNPQGYSPAALAAMRTSATDTIASQTQAAKVAAGNYAATHGGSALPSGVNAQIAGGIATAGAQSQAQAQNQITQANEDLRQQNYWRAISGLGSVMGENNPLGYAGAQTGASNASTGAGNLLLQSQQAGWANVGGIISGVAGLGLAGTQAFKNVNG